MSNMFTYQLVYNNLLEHKIYHYNIFETKIWDHRSCDCDSMVMARVPILLLFFHCLLIELT